MVNAEPVNEFLSAYSVARPVARTRHEMFQLSPNDRWPHQLARFQLKRRRAHAVPALPQLCIAGIAVLIGAIAALLVARGDEWRVERLIDDRMGAEQLN